MSKLLNIKVIGSGTTGLMVATYLKTKKPDLQIEIYTDPSISPIIVGESSQPWISKYFDTVFKNDEEWMDECNSTYKFYVKHDDWNSKGHSWTFPLCDERSDVIDFSDITLSECESKLLTYSKNNLAPRQRTAWHMQSTKLQPLLLKKCKELYIPVFYEKFDFTFPELEGSFIIDCRGFTGQENYEQVSPAIINNYAIASHVDHYEDSQERYYTQTLAHEVGWRWEIPLQDCLGVGRVFSTDFLSESEAIDEMNVLYGERDWYKIPFTSCINKNPCTNHTLKIGSSAVFIEPLESTTLMLVTFMVDTFYQMAKSWNWNIDDIFVENYNAGFNEMVESQVTYIEGFYCISDRRDSEYWRYVTSHYDWYKQKIKNNGWPKYFGKYGFEKFFGSYGKFETFKNLIGNYET